MKRILILLSLLAVASCHGRDHGTPAPRYRHILLRDFRTVYDGRVINYNIGTAAHGPATLNVLKKHLPADVDITIWASAPLDSTLSAMMERRFPEVRIVCGQYENPSEASPELRDAVAESDLFLVSSVRNRSRKSVCAKNLSMTACRRMSSLSAHIWRACGLLIWRCLYICIRSVSMA